MNDDYGIPKIESFSIKIQKAFNDKIQTTRKMSNSKQD